jgi:hypothetical protein
MHAAVFPLVLGAALLQATWNALVKSDANISWRSWGGNLVRAASALPQRAAEVPHAAGN